MAGASYSPLPELVDELVKHRDRIGEAISELEATRTNLDTIIAGERRTD